MYVSKLAYRRELNGEELSSRCIAFDEAEYVEEAHRPPVLSEDVEHSARVNGSPATPNTELDKVTLHARGERVLNAVASECSAAVRVPPSSLRASASRAR